MYGNQFGYCCPTCVAQGGDREKEADESITIEAVRYILAQLLPNGTDDDGGDTEWDDDSHASCGCGWHGQVKDLIIREDWAYEL